jgi:hypothetical protein
MRRDDHHNVWRNDPPYLIEKVMGIPLWKAQRDILFGWV